MLQSQEKRLKIGQIAARAGVSVDTVRYYEQRGILPAPVRLPSGYRTYPPSSASRIMLARRLRAAGMSIDEIVDALAAHDDGGTCGSEIWRLEAVRERIDTQIAQLTELRDVLTPLIEACADGCCELTPLTAFTGDGTPRPPASPIPSVDRS
jgi:DNA-binding transcriptional MerR regulator